MDKIQPEGLRSIGKMEQLHPVRQGVEFCVYLLTTAGARNLGIGPFFIILA
jgi:hypothetical protein